MTAVDVPADSPYGLDHLPYGVFSAAGETPRVGVRVGDLVLDPDCGAGTVLIEALRAGRHALGLTIRKPWWTLARANVTAAKAAGALCDGSVIEARPRMLATVRAAGMVGRVGLVLTAIRTSPERDRVESALSELAKTLQYCEPLLRSGGHVGIVARPQWRSDGSLVDFTSSVVTAATTAGLVLVERCVALSVELRGSRLVVRGSGRARRAAHHEVLVFQLAHDAELAAESFLREIRGRCVHRDPFPGLSGQSLQVKVTLRGVEPPGAAEALVLVCAVCFAMQIVLLDRVADSASPSLLAWLQNGAVALLCALWIPLEPHGSLSAPPLVWVAVGAMALLAMEHHHPGGCHVQRQAQ